MTEQLATLDWQRYIFSAGGSPPYFATHNIPLAPTQLGQYRIEMSISASGFADDVKVTGNYRIFNATGEQIADQRGIQIRYSGDLERSAERWLKRCASRSTSPQPSGTLPVASPVDITPQGRASRQTAGPARADKEMIMSEIEYPLSIRDISPAPDAVRLTGTRPDGLPDGVHTGGAWLTGGEVWKPLDGRPFVNCPVHVATIEAECLEEMAGQPFFPRNWRIEERNGRRFLVRPEAIIADFSTVEPRLALQVEQAVRLLNRAGWTLGDDVSLGRTRREWFIVDLSNAQRDNRAHDWHRIEMFFRQCDLPLLANLRKQAIEALNNMECHILDGYGHVYASFNRPIDGMWADIPGAVYVHTGGADRAKGVPHTWVATVAELGTDVLERYELAWGWSPLR